MFSEEDDQDIVGPISLEEIFSVLKSFYRDKCLGPDGWTVEIFTHFHEIMAANLLKMVEESRHIQNVSGTLNVTFIMLIPKSSNPKTFCNYRPISLCNIFYKLMSNTFANRMKVHLSSHISARKFGFLKNQQIHDVVAITQEALHFVETRRKDAIILKLYIHRALNCVD